MAVLACRRMGMYWNCCDASIGKFLLFSFILVLLVVATAKSLVVRWDQIEEIPVTGEKNSLSSLGSVWCHPTPRVTVLAFAHALSRQSRLVYCSFTVNSFFWLCSSKIWTFCSSSEKRHLPKFEWDSMVCLMWCFFGRWCYQVLLLGLWVWKENQIYEWITL